MKVVNSKLTAENQDINSQLRQIRKIKYQHNTEQRRIFEHLIQSGAELDLKKPEHYRIIANGIPQCYREIVWTQLLTNIHGITPKLYENLLKKASKTLNQNYQANKIEELPDLNLSKSKSQGFAPSKQINLQSQKIAKWFDTIKQDIPRTFSELKIFQSKQNLSQQHQQGSLNQQTLSLMNILSCWTLFREDLGYRQGMSHIAGYLVIQLNNQLKSFQIFCSIVTSDVLHQFLTMNLEYISHFCGLVSLKLQERNEELHQFFQSYEIDYKLFILDWIFNLFTKCFQLDTVGKIWDLLLLNGMEQDFIILIIVEMLCSFEEEIYNYKIEGIDPMGACRFLKKAKVNEVREDKVLKVLRNFKSC